MIDSDGNKYWYLGEINWDTGNYYYYQSNANLKLFFLDGKGPRLRCCNNKVEYYKMSRLRLLW